VTIAQLVHPARALERQPHRPLSRAPQRAASQPLSCNATLWREIGIGLAFALIGLAMMALAIGAAGVAPPTSAAHGGASAAAQTASHHRPEVYPDPAGPVTEVAPVP
jgi:hypothetical protein